MGPALNLSVVIYPVRLHWRTIFSFAHGRHLQITSWLGMRAHVYFYFFPPRTPFGLTLRVLPQSPEFMCTGPVVSEAHCLLGVFHPLWFLESPCLLFHTVPWALRRGSDEDTTLPTERSKVSHSLHTAQHDEAEQVTNPWVRKNVFRSQSSCMCPISFTYRIHTTARLVLVHFGIVSAF